MKKVSYAVHEGQEEIDMLDGLIAYRLDPAYFLTGEYSKDLGPSAFGEQGTRDELDGVCLRAFEEGLWYFCKPHDSAVLGQYSHKSLPPGVVAAGTVCKDQHGSLKVALPSLYVRVDPSISVEKARALLDSRDLIVTHTYRSQPNAFLVSTRGREAFEVTDACHGNSGFVCVEPEIVDFVGTRFTPRESRMSQLWHLHRIGVQDAWDMEVTGQGVNMALIDTGFDVDHFDLRTASTPLCGFYEDHSFHRPRGGDPLFFPTDKQRHGTFCAGVALARMNNEGIVGVAPHAQLTGIIPLRNFLTSQHTLARAIEYACDPMTEGVSESGFHGADVISCSLGPDSRSMRWPLHSSLRSAIDHAVTNGRNGKGTPVFWAVANMNDDMSQDRVVSYHNTIAVGASNERDTRRFETAHGRNLEFLAPGENIISTRAAGMAHERGDLGVDAGSSFAAPIAAGIAALMISANPDITASGIREIMRDTCKKIGPEPFDTEGRNNWYGYGLVQAGTAVAKALELRHTAS